jgi:hypothetical protein
LIVGVNILVPTFYRITGITAISLMMLRSVSPLLKSFVWLAVIYTVQGFSTTTKNSKLGVLGNANGENWHDYLLFGGSTPTFDILEKTKEYTSTAGYRSFRLTDIPTDYYADDYIFRGPIVGPINRKELVETNTLTGLKTSFPDLDRQAFGFTVDPENPFRVLYFERWYATNSGDLSFGGDLLTAPATGKKSVSAAFPFSVVWNPEGKIVYEHLSTAVDRFEGKNTNGKVAVFGLLESAGISLNNNIGDPLLIFQQKLGRFLNLPVQVFSKDEDIPSWWKSKARGADFND